MSDATTRTRTLLVPPPAAAETARPSLRVTVLAGPDRGASCVVARDRVVVGRGATADLVLTDPTVSQFHAELAFAAPAHVSLLDLGSRNGTRLGEALVRDATVPAGTEVALGSTLLRVELAEDFRAECSADASFGGLVGASRAMRELYAVLARLARTELTVLLEGETGTGKEVAARAVHAGSPRGAGPFLALDCTAIPPALAESVLFGHEKGAFTGATARRAGVFEAAAGGTLLLDEVGELPLDLQPKLLRVLERREVVPVGATQPLAVNVRIVAATWRDLRKLVNQGAFREDLYHRLAQARVRLPSLAERPEDIRPLVHHFLAGIAYDVPAARAIADDALELLVARPYPGNVRELKNTVERVAMLADGAVITPADLAFERMLAAERVRGPGEGAQDAAGTRGTSGAGPQGGDAGAPLEPFKEAKRSLIDEFERQYLARLLARAGTNVSLAARLAGLERPSLRELLRRHGLRGGEE